jgi:polysaccharide export outer membrane protein
MSIVGSVAAQQAPPPAQNGTKPQAAVTAPTGVTPPADYVIGPDDLLTIVFFREKDMTADVAVRPDGMISLPLLNDVQASGLTPEQLRAKITEASAKFFEDPTVTVVVKAINSRKVFITGMVNKQGPHTLAGPTTVLQLISMAGGLLEYADEKNIRILRYENGQPVTFVFNYKDVSKGKNLKQNILLKPGDTIIVP